MSMRRRRTRARRRLALQLGRRIEIVARDAVGAGDVAEIDHAAEHHHVAVGVAGAQPRQVGGSLRNGRSACAGDVIGAAEQVEVVDIGRAEIGLDRVVDGGDRHAELLRLDAVDVDEDLRRVGGERREHRGEPRVLARGGDKFVGRGRQQLRTAALAILDAHGEAAAGADAGHGRRRNDDDEGALDCREALAQVGGDGGGGQALLQAHLRLVEHRKQRRRIAGLRARRAREAGKAGDADDAGRIQRDPLDLAHHMGGALQRRGARQLHGDDDVAAILRRNEALRRDREQPAGAADQHDIDQQHHQPNAGSRNRPHRHRNATAGRSRD